MKKDAFYFPHFCNARHDRKIKRIQKDLGLEGYGIFFMLLEVLREQTDFKYPYEDLDLLADEFGTSIAKVEVVVNNYGLFNFDNEKMFFSPKLLVYLQPYLEKSDRAKKAIEKRWSKYNEQKLIEESTDTNVLQMYNKCNTNHNTSKVKESKVKESKVKESKVLSVPTDPTLLPISFKKIFGYDIPLNLYQLLETYVDDGMEETLITNIFQISSEKERPIPYIKATCEGMFNDGTLTLNCYLDKQKPKFQSKKDAEMENFERIRAELIAEEEARNRESTTGDVCYEDNE